MDMMKMIDDVEGLPPPKEPKKKPKKEKKGAKKATDETIFGVIGNPSKMADSPVADDKKKKKKKKTKFSNMSDDGSLSISSAGSFSGSDGSSVFSDDRSTVSGSSFDDRQNFTVRKRKEEIMQEKIEMLTRISKMSHMGFTATKKWSMKDDIDEIRFECYRMTRENNSRKALKNMQHMLITAATIVEFANSVVNPFNLKLTGFSKNLMLTVSDYDDSLEELHHKWSGRTSVGPEMTVLFTFVTSAIFHHAGNVMNSPSESKAKQKGPDISSVLGLFSNMMPKAPPPMRTEPKVVPKVVEIKEPSPDDPAPKKRRPMKGPGGASLPFANIVPSMQVPGM